ncbi:ethanolaminephosphotransferase 1 [Alligator mississippiensis]|uniref:Ethanolaminephosphotransferase 1 n=1 Tax=Alligator mississippiensis TaxID=8496 RepID=A0A151MNM6_ALLMI|nr:ethanolaminephosphotransferase 1 [Alligator mississippiensis]KYO26147.1 ethanolaminephosphotransferase 1-like [Alligator mississippiensis]
MWRVQYVSAQQLAGFRQYKYSAVDTNPLSVHVMQPMWDQIVKIVPQWVAPNLLTFSGFVVLLINYFLLSFYDWDYTASGTSPGSIPTWVWLFSAFATFCAYTLDSIDGKHARRTHCSTPLGELFDHGLDSWATSIFTLNFFSLCSRGNEQTGFLLHKMFLSLSIALLNFMVSHWEKYNTGVLFLPWGYDISQVVQIVLYLLTAATGVEIWHRPILFGYYIVDILILLIIGLSIVLSFPQTLYNIYKAYLKKTLKRDSFYDGCVPLVSPILLFTLISIWVTLSPCDILAKQTRMFFWMLGVTFSNILVRMIICQMSNTRPKVFHWFLFPLALVVYTAVTGQLGRMEPIVLALFNMFVTAAHVHYGICVVRQLSDYFNIYTFSLKKRI